MKQYEVLEAFELDGTQHEVGEKIELTEEQASDLGGKVKEVEKEDGGEEESE